MVDIDERHEAEKPEGLEAISTERLKSPKLPETTYHQLKPYKLAEERIFVDSGIKDFLVYGGKALYGTVASMFRMPTLVRKAYNHQTWSSRDREINVESPERSIALGFAIGGTLGFLLDIGYLFYSSQQAFQERNYLPLAVLGATNLASGIFELGRLSRSKQERLEVKAQIEAEKVKAEAEILRVFEES